MNTVKLIYDSDHHVTAIKEPQHKIVSVDCPYTGDGAEFSPANLLSISLGSCMLLSIGTVAQRANLDLSGTTVSVHFKEVAKPFPHVAAIHYVIRGRSCLTSGRQLVANAPPLYIIRIAKVTDLQPILFRR
jgi:uncharacterized OsmC-like protein